LIAVAPEAYTRHLPAFPTRRPSDLIGEPAEQVQLESCDAAAQAKALAVRAAAASAVVGRAAHADERELLGTDRPRAGASRFEVRSEEHTSELQSRENLVCRLLLEKK